MEKAKFGKVKLVFASLLVATSGCAFPNGSTQGDPLLGNFHRPIVATPSPERGGMGPGSPAYDGGARIGMMTPDIPTNVENSNGLMTLPQLTSPNLFSGMRMPFSAENGTTTASRFPGTAGAQLMMHDNGIKLPQPTGFSYGQISDNSIQARPKGPMSSFISGASMTPSAPMQIQAMNGTQLPVE